MNMFDTMNSGWIFFAGCGLLTAIVLRRTFRRIGRSKTNSSEPIERVARPTSKWDGAQRDALAQVERQKVEMYDMSRDLNGQLTSRILVLERLIGESQLQIERLEALLAKTDHSVQEPTDEALH